MQIRAATAADLSNILEIDGTVESTQYLHIDRSGESLAACWRIDERPLRQKLIEPNPLDDERRFVARQIVTGAEDGAAVVCEHDNLPVAVLLGVIDPQRKALRVIDLRVDYDIRRQGVGSAMLFGSIQDARQRGLRAVTAQTQSNNAPGARFLLKAGFELAGLDTHHLSNHDLVKEQVSLFWYAALD